MWYVIIQVKFVKKGFGEKVEAVLKRLDLLTHDKAWTTAIHTLKVVYVLVQNMEVIMDSMVSNIFKL